MTQQSLAKRKAAFTMINYVWWHTDLGHDVPGTVLIAIPYKYATATATIHCTFDMIHNHVCTDLRAKDRVGPLSISSCTHGHSRP